MSFFIKEKGNMVEKESTFGFVPIIKCVGFECNMKCEYCFYHQLEESHQSMNLEVLEALIKETYQANIHSPMVNFIWHGGEPLVVGKKFYQKVVELQKKYNQSQKQVTINGLQTNGTLIDEEWVKFFKANEFQIGISLDGPPEYHDLYRRYPKGRGSFKDVMKGIKILRKNDIPFGIVSVITDVSVYSPERMFRFFVENELYDIKFSRALGRDYYDGRLLKFAPNPDEYGNFLLQILELWLEEDNPQLKITPINEIFISLLRGECGLECLFSNKCDRFWIVNPDGSVHACISEGIGEKWCFGNINAGSETLIHSSVFQEFQEMVTDLRKSCLKCKWYNICKGGCTIDYELEFFSQEKRNVLCKTFQRLFQKAEEKLIQYGLV